MNLIRIKTPPDLYPEAQAALIEAGCTVEEYISYTIVQFPTGTTREEIRPRTMNERYHVTLPDGKVLVEKYLRYMELSLLFIPWDMVTKEGQADENRACVQ